MSAVIFDTANKDDIPELIRLRLAYIIDDYGSINESEIDGKRIEYFYSDAYQTTPRRRGY